MPLNPQVEAVLAMFAQAPLPDPDAATAPELRAIMDVPVAVGEPPAVAEVRELDIPLAGRTVQARLYIPEQAGENPPLIMFYHGGGWVIGTLETYDATARALARASGAAVLSLGYRLSPEHPYPAPLDDCYDALCWAVENAGSLGVDGTRIAVAGDSAGGNLAAAVAIMARDRGGPALRHQCLIYPVTDRDFATATYRAYGGGDHLLSTARMQWFWQQYIGDTPPDARPLAAVLREPDLSRLPPAYLITAQYDPLHDEGIAYADRLKAADVPVVADTAPGMIHGFISMFDLIPDAMPWLQKAADEMRRALA